MITQLQHSLQFNIKLRSCELFTTVYYLRAGAWWSVLMRVTRHRNIWAGVESEIHYIPRWNGHDDQLMFSSSKTFISKICVIVNDNHWSLWSNNIVPVPILPLHFGAKFFDIRKVIVIDQHHIFFGTKFWFCISTKSLVNFSLDPYWIWNLSFSFFLGITLHWNWMHVHLV